MNRVILHQKVTKKNDMNPSSFELRYPAVIRFGWGVRRELPMLLRELTQGLDLVPVFLVASRSALQGPCLEEFKTLCGSGLEGIFTEVPHDPSLATVNAIIARIRETGAAVVIAVGGGSVIDAAKAAAAVAPFGPAVEPFFHGKQALSKPGLPLVALPTTAGSGAEVTLNAVLTDADRRVKKSLRSLYMAPKAALVDVELTMSQPREQTAWSGLDAFTQALESYLSRKTHSVSRILAIQAMKQLLRFLPAAVNDGADREARTAVAEGSLLSGMAFSQSGLGAVHGLAHPLGVALNLPHGYTCAVLLPHILALNAPVCSTEFQELALAFGLPDGAAVQSVVQMLCRDLDVPPDFRAHGLSERHFPEILANCRSNSMQANPRELTDTEILSLLRQLSEGTPLHP